MPSRVTGIITIWVYINEHIEVELLKMEKDLTLWGRLTTSNLQ